ncbi:putative integral membrane protein [Babesia bovis T2Bo]|uniref:putative integral membrane protein n=1 Tax=Babesia bovis T2Bo TaxID=484906 RepID=UPI001DEFAA8C|nr:putative integral membrane protein [Babesia bovis T2Bo]KAG6439945.1 putative integral membrane protein [Babesia bovis T2Bo]
MGDGNTGYVAFIILGVLVFGGFLFYNYNICGMKDFIRKMPSLPKENRLVPIPGKTS